MGPLKGMKVIEIAGIGPGQICAMLLADLGADVLRIEREQPGDLGVPRPLRTNLTLRGRKAIALDLKKEEAVQLVLRLVERADALIEGFRPGVMERLGLGPDACMARNERLIYGRVTGWGQDGPLSSVAGHDINYVALSGALNAIGRRGQPPSPPLNLVGEAAGGALYLAFGIMCALFETQRSGRGQMIDAAVVDGVSSMLTNLYGLHAAGRVSERGTNVSDSGSYFYNVYECADGKYVSISSIEGRFHAELLRRLEIDPKELPPQWDKSGWQKAYAVLAERFKTKTRDEWCSLLEGSEACFAPVLSVAEAPQHPHFVARKTFLEIDGIVQPAPAPRFSRTVPDRPTPPEAPDPGASEEVIASWLA